jgi:DNA-binding transcriptional regulator/RsmH inhibitor MraZ
MSKPRPTSALELGQHLEQFQIQGNHLENVQQTAKQIETLVFKKDSRLCNDERRHVVIPPLLRMLGFRTVCCAFLRSRPASKD